MKTHYVTPEPEKDYSDSFHSTMYGTIVGMATNEIYCIWMRYSGFLIVVGLLIAGIGASCDKPKVAIAYCLVGLWSSICWIIMNYFGWWNQNQYLYQASQFRFTKLDIDLPTDWTKDKPNQKPVGIIYWLAQSLPSSFILLFDYLLYDFLKTEYLGISCSLVFTLVPLGIAILLITTVIYVEKNNRNKSADRIIA